MSIGIALLGAGIFAKEAHIPGIKACSDLELKAIYSRSFTSAENLATEVGSGIDVYGDSPSTKGKSLDDLLTRSDISAVIVVLPILVQPDVIKKAILAGKHVLSEKPVAKDVKDAEELIKWYAGVKDPPIWAVGENFRYVEFAERATESLRRVGGDVRGFSMRMYAMTTEDNKYYQTEWRKTPGYQGGFLLDAGVHFIAALRRMLGAVGQDITSVSAFTKLHQEKLAPVDTVHSIWTTTNGSGGTFSLSFGIEADRGLEFEVITSRGRVRATSAEVSTITKDAGGSSEEDRVDISPGNGVNEELVAFAASIQRGQVDEKETPEEALVDLRLLEYMLKSGEQGGINMKI